MVKGDNGAGNGKYSVSLNFSGMVDVTALPSLNLDRETTVRVILLKGAEKAFCAGIDIEEFFNKTAMEYRAPFFFVQPQ